MLFEIDLLTAIGYVIGLLGLLGSVHYGRRSHEIERAFLRYAELDVEVSELRRALGNRQKEIEEIEESKAEILFTETMRIHSPDALRLARAAELRAQHKRAEEQMQSAPDRFIFIAEGDHQTALPALLQEHNRLSDEPGQIVKAGYDVEKNRTTVWLKGVKWRQLLRNRPEWTEMRLTTGKNRVAHAAIRWSKSYALLGEHDAPILTSWNVNPTGESGFVDIRMGSGPIHRLGVLATIDDYRPIPIAEYFEGSSEEVENSYRSWVKKNITTK